MKKLPLLLLLATGCASAPPRETVLFLCPYGGAKSVIAASYFNRIAEERRLPYVGVAAATETPYEAVPAAVVALLARDGIDVRGLEPRRAAPGEAASAARVIAIDCQFPRRRGVGRRPEGERRP